MTKEEYNKICKIIDSNTELYCDNVSFTTKVIISSNGIYRIKKELQKLVTSDEISGTF